MKLYVSELKKLCASRLLAGLFVGLLGLNALLAAMVSVPTPAEAAAREAYARYLADPAATDAYYRDLGRLAAENFRDETYTLPHTYTAEADDLLVLTLLYERIDYLAGHEGHMAQLVRSADTRIADLQFYGYGEDSYAIRREREMRQCCERLRGVVSPTDVYAYGYDAYLSYPMTAIFAGLFLTVAVAYIHRNDRACGFGAILRTTRGGHAKTALAKLGATATAALATTFFLSVSAFAAMGVTVGYSSPAAAVQTLPRYATVPFAVSVGEYLALRLCLCALSMLTYAGVVAVAASLQMPYVGCFGVGALFWGGNYALFAQDSLGTPPAVRYLNFVSLAEGNTLTDFCRSVSVFGYPVAHPTALCAAAILLTLLLFAAAAWLFLKNFRGLSVWHGMLGLRLPARKRTTTHKAHRPRRVPLTLVGYEGKKMRLGWLLFAALLLLGAKGIYTSATAGTMARYDEALYYESITAIQPMTVAERTAHLSAERARIDAVMADYPVMTAACERGEMTHEAYAAYLDAYYAARARDGVLRRVENYVSGIEAHDRLTGVESDILYTTGLEVFFGYSSDRCFFLAVLLLSVGVFAVEYRKTSSQGDAASLIRTTPRGRGRTFGVKLCLCTVSGCLLAVAFRAVGLWVVARGYILPAMDATLSSVPNFGVVLSDVTIGQYLLLDFAVQALVGALSGAGIASLSCLCRRPLPILSAVLLFIALPELLTSTLFPQAHTVGLLSLTTPHRLFLQSVSLRLLSCTGAWMAVVCLALTLLVLTLVLLAARTYNRHPTRRKEHRHDPVVSSCP